MAGYAAGVYGSSAADGRLWLCRVTEDKVRSEVLGELDEEEAAPATSC